MDLLLTILIDSIITGLMVWLAAKLTAIQIEFKEAAACVAISSLVRLIPIVGWLASIVIYFYLLKHFSKAKIWPDIILLVFVSKFLSLVTLTFLLH